MQRNKNWKKLIVERPRVGGSRKIASKIDRARENHIGRQGRWDDLPKQERMFASGQVGWDDGYAKELSDYLSPLRRWIDKQVGRKWDDVYSELCGMVDRRSTLGAHVFDHLMRWVHPSVVVYDNGEVWEHGKYGPSKLSTGWGRIGADLYVDPDTGLLKAAVDPSPYVVGRKKRKEQDKAYWEARLLNKDGHRYEKLGGIWYETTPRLVVSRQPIYEVIYLPPAEGLSAWQRRQNILVGHREVRELVYDVKRQLAKKELRRLGLANDRP